MKVLIAGATGVLGRELIRQLIARGHAAVGLARRNENLPVIERLGAEARRGDLFDVPSLVAAGQGCDVVIHAATAIPTSQRPRRAEWERNDRIRRAGTAALTECAVRIGAQAYLQQSITWVARPADDGPFDEQTVPEEQDPIVQSALDGERIAQRAAAQSGFRLGVLRYGLFYSAEAQHTRMMAAALSRRQLPILGRGLWTMIHVRDAARAMVAVAESNRSGLWHVVDNLPVGVDVYLGELARRLAAPEPRNVPAWLVRWLAGKYVAEFFARSHRTTNRRFCEDFGWQPEFPSYREGLDQVIAHWEAESFVVGSQAA